MVHTSLGFRYIKIFHRRGAEKSLRSSSFPRKRESRVVKKVTPCARAAALVNAGCRLDSPGSGPGQACRPGMTAGDITYDSDISSFLRASVVNSLLLPLRKQLA